MERIVDADLTALAQQRAVEIQSDFSHQGVPPNTAEIIAWNSNPDPVTRLAAQWQGSLPHWAILTDPSLTRWGCGISQKGTAFYAVCLFRSGDGVITGIPLEPISPVPLPAPPVQLLPNTAMETSMNRFDVARIHLDMWKRHQVENLRLTLLKAVPRSWLYHLTIQATVRALRSDEHPDAIGAMEVVRRLQKVKA